MAFLDIWVSQETASCFVKRLSTEYKEYNDVAQPIQVAVYEMKLGLSLILSGALWKKNLNRTGVDSTEQVMVMCRIPSSSTFSLCVLMDYLFRIFCHNVLP